MYRSFYVCICLYVVMQPSNCELQEELQSYFNKGHFLQLLPCLITAVMDDFNDSNAPYNTSWDINNTNQSWCRVQARPGHTALAALPLCHSVYKESCSGAADELGQQSTKQEGISPSRLYSIIYESTLRTPFYWILNKIISLVLWNITCALLCFEFVDSCRA